MATLADTPPCLTHTVSQPHQGGMVSPQTADVEVEAQRLRNLATVMELVNRGPGFELKFTLISKAMIFSKLPHPTQLLGDLMSSYLTYFKVEHPSQTTNRVTGVQPYWLPHDPRKSANYPCIDTLREMVINGDCKELKRRTLCLLRGQCPVSAGLSQPEENACLAI